MRRSLSGLLALAVTLTLPAIGQHYPILQVPGAPHEINTMMQDHRSALWIGTGDDVLCFDGERFYSLHASGFPKETAQSLAEDSDGGIWVVTSDSVDGQRGGVYRYFGGHVEKIRSGGGLSIVSVAPGVLLATLDAGQRPRFGDLDRIRKVRTGWKIERILARDAGKITIDHQGTALFPCSARHCELTRQQILSWPANGSEVLRTSPGFGDDSDGSVLRDKFGCVWERNEVEASYRCPGDAHTNRVSFSDVSTDSSTTLLESKDGRILMLGSLMYGRPGSFKVARARNGVPYGLKSALIADDGVIWLGGTNGLYRFMSPFQMEYWDQGNGVEAPYTLLRVGNDMYAGNNGIAKLDKDRSNWHPLDVHAVMGTVVHLLLGKDGNIYSGSLLYGVREITPQGRVIARQVIGPGVARLAQNERGKIWLAGFGVSQVVRDGDRLRLVPEDIGTDSALDMQYDPARNTLWSCYGPGIAAKEGTRWRYITGTDGLLKDDCQTVAVHPNGDVWVGYGNLSSFSLVKNAFTSKMTVKNYQSGGEIGDAKTSFLDSDGRGWLWRASSSADYVATPAAAEAGNWLRLDASDGIPVPGGNQNAFYNDPDGSIWFGSDDTIVHFNPTSDFATDFSPPKIFLSGFSSGQQAATLIGPSQPLKVHTGFVAHVGSLDFNRRNALRLRFRVLPGQSQWKETKTLDISFAGLHWGRHLLQVQGQLSTGMWSPVVEQPIVVSPPLWFWPLLLAMTGALFGMTVTIRHRMIERRFAHTAHLPDLSAWRMDARSPELQDLIGTTIDGQYEVGHVLSVGGFATVAAARDLSNKGELCAVKVFRYELADQPWIRHRFQHEVRALGQLNHPNIVKIVNHGTTDSGSPYLSMEFIQGQNLREILQEGPLRRDRIAVLLRQLASALELLHNHNIIHRDIKPENLMVRDNSAHEDQIVLIDFSIAIVKSPDETFHGISRVAGTIGYMAPEQVTGYADASTDIHSLAKVVIEMLTGKQCAELVPEATLDLPDHIRKYFLENPGPLGMDGIASLAQALSFDPADRPKDVWAFAQPVLQDLGANP